MLNNFFLNRKIISHTLRHFASYGPYLSFSWTDQTNAKSKSVHKNNIPQWFKVNNKKLQKKSKFWKINALQSIRESHRQHWVWEGDWIAVGFSTSLSGPVAVVKWRCVCRPLPGWVARVAHLRTKRKYMFFNSCCPVILYRQWLLCINISSICSLDGIVMWRNYYNWQMIRYN